MPSVDDVTATPLFAESITNCPDDVRADQVGEQAQPATARDLP